VQSLRIPGGTVSSLSRLYASDNNSNRILRQYYPRIPYFDRQFLTEHFLGSSPMYLERTGLIFEREDTAYSEERHMHYLLSEESNRFPKYLEHINRIADSSFGASPVLEMKVKMKFKVIE